MKKRIICFILSAALLLSSCETQEKIVEKSTTPTQQMTKTSETASETAVISTALNATSNSSVDTLEEIPYNEEYPIDSIIEKQLWERCSFDFTKNDTIYPYSVEYECTYDEFIEVKNKELGHQYLYMLLDYTYLGNEEADWICTANYMSDVAIPSLIYSEIVLIKDNQVIRQVCDIYKMLIVGVYVSNGEVFVHTYGGLSSLDLNTGETQMLIDDNYGELVHIDENYIIFGERNIRIYNRITGEITETGINHSTYGMPSYKIRLNENRLEYVDMTTGKGMVYDIETGEIYEDESLVFESH